MALMRAAALPRHGDGSAGTPAVWPGGLRALGGHRAAVVEIAGRWLGTATLLLFAAAVGAAPPGWLIGGAVAALMANSALVAAGGPAARRATGGIDLLFMTLLAAASGDPAVRVALLGVATFWVLQPPRDAALLCLALTVADVAPAVVDGDAGTAGVLLVAGLWTGTATAAAASLRLTRACAEEGLRSARSRIADDLLQAETQTHLRFAAELHDGPLQLLLAAGQDLGESDDPAAARAAELIARSTRELRALVQGLEPAPSAGQTAKQLRDWSTVLAARYRFDGVVEVDDRLTDVHPVAASAARELLSNAARHARARRIRVAIAPGPGGAGLTVTVEDDGVGFDPRSAAGLGLSLLRRRVADAGGTLAIDGRAGGTRAEVSLPA